jgi:hypothetical protein
VRALAKHDRVEVEALLSRIRELESEVRELRVYAPVRPPQGWLGVRQAAHKRGVSASLVYQWIRRGKVKALKLRGVIWIDGASLPGV